MNRGGDVAVYDIADASDNWRLEVYRDAQLIGTLELPEAGILIVGGSVKHDVVLRDESAGDTQLRLNIQKPLINVEVTNGTVEVDELVHVAGDQFLGDNRSIRIGSLVLSFIGVEAHVVTHSSTKDVPPQIVSKVPDAKSRRNRLTTAAIVTSVLTLFGVGSWQVLASLRPEPPKAETIVRTFINDAELHQVTVENVGNSLVVAGTVESNEERMRFEGFLRQQPFRVKQEFVVLEQLKTQLEDVFRVNGVTADVTIDDAGVLQAATQISDTEQLELIRQAVASDVPQLLHWELHNVAPPVSDNKIKEDSGKRVAMVISDEPAHVLTVDQTRYFIGSILPTGHRVDDIRDGRVFLLKDGSRSELDF